MRIIIWGTGGACNLGRIKGVYKDEDILAYVDNAMANLGGYIDDIKIIPPNKISDYDYDKIILCMFSYSEVMKQCIEELGIEKNKIMTHLEFETQLLCKKMIDKYSQTSDPEIKSIIENYKKNGFNLFGTYENKHETMDLVHYDESNTPYILFEGKRMFFPKDYKFVEKDGNKYYPNILFEQGEGSPHLYIRNADDIKENAVIVDAGVCEGNFALRYVDKAQKLYLIESDPLWIEALEKTFSEYKDKVVIVDKFLGRYDNKTTITLDTLVKEKIDFLKMDIEGSEIDALLGGRKVLENSNDLKCAVCSYHNKRDEEYIKLILHTYGYETEVSKGYICYQYDLNIFESLDFRKGVVYGKRQRLTS